MSEGAEGIRPFLERVWDPADEEELLPEDVEVAATHSRDRLRSLPVYKDSEPSVDKVGNSIRQFEHGQSHYLVFETPPRRGSNEFSIQVMESSAPISLVGAKVDLTKNPDLRQYGLSMDAISYFSPNIADANVYEASSDRGLLASMPPLPPFDPMKHKEEDKMPKMNKKGVQYEISRLISRLSTPRFKIPS